MQVSLLFFAAARDATGQSKVDLDLPPTVANVAALTVWLGEQYPALVPYLDSLRIACNEEFVDSAAGISAGDVLAVIPPVAGG
jgi:molybdopterin synthase sulfur carrier subunit